MMCSDTQGEKRFTSHVESLLRDKGNRKILSMLKDENISDLVDCDGTTLLHLATKYNNAVVISYLIDKNVDVNAVNSFGETPLMSAMQNIVNIDAWKALLDAGADLWKIKNNSGQSALMMFIQYYHGREDISNLVHDEIKKRCHNIVDIADALLSANCQLYNLDFFKKVEITKLMLERGCPVDLKDPEHQGNTALHIAVKMNDLDNIKMLLQFGANRNIRNLYDAPPIVIAIGSGSSDVELVKLLLPDDKDWIEKDLNMFKTFTKCSKEVLQLLLGRYGKDILSARDADGITPFHYLTLNRDKHFWELLKDLRLNVNVSDKDGMSVLHLAVQRSKPEVVRFLLDAGADVNLLDKEGRSPLFYTTWDLVENMEHIRERFEILLQNGADAQLVLHGRDTIVSCLVRSPRYYDLLDPLLAHLAIIEARGTALNSIILNHIDADSSSKNIFTKYKQELGEMKGKTIFGTVTFFKFLSDTDEKICKYVQNEEVVKKLSQIEAADYLHRLLRKRLERAMGMSRLRLLASQLISECVEPFKGNHVVLGNIVDFLDIKDLKLIATSTD